MVESSQSVSQMRTGRRRLSSVGPLVRRLTSTSTIQATRRFFRRQLWAWPIIAAIVLGLSGFLVDRSVENAMRSRREAELTTVLRADVEALRIWLVEQGRNADLLSKDEKLIEMMRPLLAVPHAPGEVARELHNLPAQKEVRNRLLSRIRSLGYTGYFIYSPEYLVVASDQDIPVGLVQEGYRREFVSQVLKNGPSVSKPYRSPLLLQDDTGAFRAELPTMLTAAPIRIGDGPILAVLALRIRPDDQFSRTLRIAQSGDTGETYAFDRSGMLLSNSRFDADLKRVGLLADLPNSQSILTVQLRNPGVDMTTGQRPDKLRQEQPLTENVAEAVQGRSGCNPDGYRDYRGVPVVGAWEWLPEYDFGVATEIDQVEAFAAVYILRRAFWSLMVLLALASVGIFVAMLVMARQQRQLQAAALQARQLGQYSLEEKLGAGGMGTVYKGRHAMLHRPTAVKVLESGKLSDAAISRFEREVQITATLTHPNTIAVFDFGRTPEGLFYYSMEYLEGLNLEEMIRRHGPLPEGRLIYLLRQICGSLAEAHAAGLVHRDIKPANIFLTRRGGLHDFIKVLDFGLAKPFGGSDQANLTTANAIAGTPLYLSPEAVSHPDLVDARSDVYSVGALAYYLLTGTTVFRGDSVIDVCMKHVNEAPEAPSVRLNAPVSPLLEDLILRCLAKPQSARPLNAGVLLRELDRIVMVEAWTELHAAEWWSNRSAVSLAETQMQPMPDTANADGAPTNDMTRIVEMN